MSRMERGGGGEDRLGGGDYQCVTTRRSHFGSGTFLATDVRETITEYACTRNKLPSMHAFAICMCTHVRGFVSCACKFSRIIA